MLVHTAYSRYGKDSKPIRKGYTMKERYERALSKENYDETEGKDYLKQKQKMELNRYRRRFAK